MSQAVLGEANPSDGFAESFGGRFLPYRRYPGWMGAEVVAALLDYACLNQDLFGASEIIRPNYTGVDCNARVSERTRRLGDFHRLFVQRALAQLPEVCAAFGCGEFAVQDVEVELVAHGDGAFFSCHSDTLGGRSRAGRWPRRVTMVYYLHALPKAFSGGDLRYYSIDGTKFKDIEPDCDEMVAFPSWALHSVERVSLDSGAFRDRRFAVNMWIKG